MHGIFHFANLYCQCLPKTCLAFLVVLLCPMFIHSSEYGDYGNASGQIEEYFENVDEETDVHEIIHFIVSWRLSLSRQGYQIPSVRDFVFLCQQYLQSHGILLSQEEREYILDSLERAESFQEPEYFSLLKNSSAEFYLIKKHKHLHKHKNKNETHLSSKMICGFLKFLAGSLCCIVPVPAIQGAGAALAVQGVSEMVDAAREEGDQKQREEEFERQRYLESHI